MAENRHERRNRTKKPKRFTGTMKWLDTERVGYIICGDVEVIVTPFSLSSDVIKEGDKVSFSVKSQKSNPKFEAIDVGRVGVECHRCSRTGHYSYDCPVNMKYYWVNCFKCGLVGHYADHCDQKFYGWFVDNTQKFYGLFVDDDAQNSYGWSSVKTRNRRRFVRRRCNCEEGCWLSLFGGNCRKLGSKARNTGVDSNSNSDSNKVLASFHLYWPHLIETRFKSRKCYNHDGGKEDEEEEEEVRCIVCVKKEGDVKKVEEVEDCFILEFDPTELPNLESLSLCDKSSRVVVDDEDDLCILAEKGQVACRDYPHPRHLCATNTFRKTPHEKHCKLCYCYICDIPAPCKKWTNAIQGHGLNHCDATNENPFWRAERKLAKKQTAV